MSEKKKQKKLYIILGILTLTSIIYNSYRFTGKGKATNMSVKDAEDFQERLSKEKNARESGIKDKDLKGKSAQSGEGYMPDIKKIKIEEKKYLSNYVDDSFKTTITSHLLKKKLKEIKIKSELHREMRISNEDLINTNMQIFWPRSFEATIDLDLEMPEDQVAIKEGKEIAKVYISGLETATRVTANLYYKVSLDFKNLKANFEFQLVKGIDTEGVEEAKLIYHDSSQPKFNYAFSVEGIDLK